MPPISKHTFASFTQQFLTTSTPAIDPTRCKPHPTTLRQNKAGQSAGHYAVSYQFFEMSEWLFLQDGNGGGADDTLENSFGLGPYDGLQPDGGGGGGELMLEGGG